MTDKLMDCITNPIFFDIDIWRLTIFLKLFCKSKDILHEILHIKFAGV